MKKTLIYGAIGGVALYVYLQLQKKKKLSAKETSSTKQDDASGTSIPSGTGGVKPPKPITPPNTYGSIIVKPKPIEKVPPMLVTTPKGEGDGFSVKNDAPTPPAPTVEPVIIPKPKPIFTKPVIQPKPQPKPIFTKPVIEPKPQPKPIFIKPVIEPKPQPIARPVVMPQPKPFIPKPVIKPRPIATDRPIVKPPMTIKPVVSKDIVDVKDFVIPRITAKRPTTLIR